MMGFGFIELLMVLLMFVVLLVLIGGTIAAVVWLTRRGTAGPTAGGDGGALRILRERYARGEISREEYERMRDELRD